MLKNLTTTTGRVNQRRYSNCLSRFHFGAVSSSANAGIIALTNSTVQTVRRGAVPLNLERSKQFVDKANNLNKLKTMKMMAQNFSKVHHSQKHSLCFKHFSQWRESLALVSLSWRSRFRDGHLESAESHPRSSPESGTGSIDLQAKHEEAFGRGELAKR